MWVMRMCVIGKERNFAFDILAVLPLLAVLDVTTWKEKPMSFAVMSAHVVISVTWQYFLLNNMDEIYTFAK